MFHTNPLSLAPGNALASSVPYLGLAIVVYFAAFLALVGNKLASLGMGRGC